MSESPSQDRWQARLRRAWPALRAAFVAYHALAVVVLSFPSDYKLADRARWDNARTQQELALWADKLGTTQQALDARLWSLAQGYLHVRRALAAPFASYADAFGPTQGWGMFRSPERRPGRLAVEVREAGRWRRVYQARSNELTWRRRQLDQNRMRKLAGRLPREEALFRDMSRWLAVQAAADFREAHEVRILLERFQAPTPAERRAGIAPPIEIARKSRLDLRKLRALP